MTDGFIAAEKLCHVMDKLAWLIGRLEEGRVNRTALRNILRKLLVGPLATARRHAEFLSAPVDILRAAYDEYEMEPRDLKSSLIAVPLYRLIERCGGVWTGTASKLQAELSALVDEETRRQREWPKSPKAFAIEVRQIALSLRTAGVDHAENRRPGTGARFHYLATRKNRGTDVSQCVTRG